MKPLIDKCILDLAQVFLTWLPLSHSYEHTVQFAQIAVGCKSFLCRKNRKTFRQHI